MNTLGLIHFPHSLHWYERRLCPKLLGALSSTAILPVPLHQWHFIFLDVFELMVVDEFTFVVLFVVIVVASCWMIGIWLFVLFWVSFLMREHVNTFCGAVVRLYTYITSLFVHTFKVVKSLLKRKMVLLPQ